MNLLAGIAYLGVCILGAVMVARRLLSGAGTDREHSTPAIVIWVVAFFALFQGGFHVLGYIDPSGERRLVEPLNALAVVSCVLILFGWIARKSSIRACLPGTVPRAIGGIGMDSELWRNNPILAATVGTLLLAALLLLFEFPRGFEVHAYHLPVGLHIFQSSSFAVWDRFFGHVLPASASLFFGFLLQILPERVVGSANVLFAVPLAVATYGIARHLGADKRASALATSGLFTIPLVAFSLLELNPDIGGIAFLAIAVYLILVRPVAAIPTAVLAGMAAGLAYGCKLFHAVSIGYLFVVMASGCVGERNSHQPAAIRSNLAGASLFALGVFVTGGFWMVRSYSLFDNPVYPANLPVVSALFRWSPGLDISQGFIHQNVWVRSTWEWFVYPWVEWQAWGQNFTDSAGLGAFFAAAIPVACLLVPAKILFGCDREKRSLAVLWIGATLVFAAWWFTERQPRYFMGAFVYLVPLAAWTISQCSGRRRKAYDAIVTACVAVMLFVVFSKEVLTFGDHVVYSKQFTRAQYYEYPEIIDRLPAESTIGVIGPRSLHYSLFGAKLRNRVVSYPEIMLVLRIARDERDSETMIFATVPPEIELSYSNVKRLKVTHLYVAANTTLRPGSCVSLEEIGRMDRNPVSNHLLPAPRRLIKVTLCN